jgi:hypothetical protein
LSGKNNEELMDSRILNNEELRFKWEIEKHNAMVGYASSYFMPARVPDRLVMKEFIR